MKLTHQMILDAGKDGGEGVGRLAERFRDEFGNETDTTIKAFHRMLVLNIDLFWISKRILSKHCFWSLMADVESDRAEYGIAAKTAFDEFEEKWRSGPRDHASISEAAEERDSVVDSLYAEHVQTLARTFAIHWLPEFDPQELTKLLSGEYRDLICPEDDDL